MGWGFFPEPLAFGWLATILAREFASAECRHDRQWAIVAPR